MTMYLHVLLHSWTVRVWLTSSTVEPTADAMGLPPNVLKWRDFVILAAISTRKENNQHCQATCHVHVHVHVLVRSEILPQIIHAYMCKCKYMYMYIIFVQYTTSWWRRTWSKHSVVYVVFYCYDQSWLTLNWNCTWNYSKIIWAGVHVPGVVTTAASGNPFPIPFAMVTAVDRAFSNQQVKSHTTKTHVAKLTQLCINNHTKTLILVPLCIDLHM